MIISKDKSQVFLKKIKWFKKILIDYSNKNFRVIEIGPGKGAITSHIINIFEKSKILLVEKDRGLCFKFWKLGLRIICNDILKLDSKIFSKAQIISSLPYRGGKKITLKIARSNFRSALLIIQKEVADSMLKVGTRINLLLQPWVKIIRLKNLSPDHWFNPPQVWGSLIYIIPKINLDSAEIMARRFFDLWEKKCTSKKKCTLRNLISLKKSFLEELSSI